MMLTSCHKSALKVYYSNKSTQILSSHSTSVCKYIFLLFFSANAPTTTKKSFL